MGRLRNSNWDMMLCLSLPLIAMLVLSSCMGQSAPPKPTYYYTLDYEPPSLTLEHQLPVVLRVERFAVSPPFQSQRIIYTGKGAHRNAYAYHQWISAPGELLPYFITRDMRESEGFKAVMTPQTPLTATHSLHGWVEEFIERDGSNHCVAAATIHVSLINNMNVDPTGKIMFQKRYHATEKCASETPAALAEAMSSAVSQISSDIIKDIHNRLRSAGSVKY